MTQTCLVGRQSEQGELNRLLDSTIDKHGKLVLVAGEAGMGKTRLVEECLRQSSFLVLKNAASETATPSYAPIIAILRAWLRTGDVADFTGCDSLTPYLASILPELGIAPNKSDQATLFEAITCAIGSIVRQQPTVIFLDDLQWADNATLELLPILATALQQEHLLTIGTYRSDEIPRGHPVRRLRTELRRAKQLQEIVVEPLGQEDTGRLAEQVLGQTPSPSLIATLYDRTQGMPLFVEELAATLGKSERLQKGSGGLELIPGQDLPVPDTLRDAILLRLDGLSDEAIRFLEIAAVAGPQFDLESVLNLAENESGLDELVERGLIEETKSGQGAFRHALTREAIYEEILWIRRRRLHRQLAEHLEASNAPPELVAKHWLAGREMNKARQSLLLSTQKSCRIHAYRDAAMVGRRALEIWPEGEEETLRLEVLDQLGNCAQLCGMLADAARAWREVAEGRREAKDKRPFAEVQRQLATVYELQGAWGRALLARQAAADAFAASNTPGEAAAERLAMAAHLQEEWSYSRALDIVVVAAEEAERAGRHDLIARAMGIKGHITAKLGQFEAGREITEAALELALKHNLSGPASEIYFRLAGIHEHSANYVASRDTFLTAINYCDTKGISAMGQLCMSCVAGIMTQIGEWQQAFSLCREVLAQAESVEIRMLAVFYLGMIHAYRGESNRAHKLIFEAMTLARQRGLERKTFVFKGYLAMINDLEGEYDAAVENYRLYLKHWKEWEERHYVLTVFRWAATFFANRGDKKETQACVQELSQIAKVTSNAEALASLAYALGENAVLDNDVSEAARQFDLALEFLSQLEVPLQRAQTELRAGVALVAAGERRTGIEHLVNAYQTAHKLGARPLAGKAAEELAQLGESIDKHLSPRAARQIKSGGLTRRQLEVVRQVSLGKTNQEIADELTLSSRTIDMHVGNILNKLNCRTRAEAVRKAGELGLLD
ncbi:MAG: AAA family ATPase [Anaerolineaceae bacterium]|nr:MAG: AAA family ATPase [Anaerolineaceae bacterium]